MRWQQGSLPSRSAEEDGLGLEKGESTQDVPITTGTDPSGELSQGGEGSVLVWVSVTRPTTPSLQRLLMAFSSSPEEKRQEGVTPYSRTPQQLWQDQPATFLDQVRRWRYVSSDLPCESSTWATLLLSDGPQLTEESSRLIRERRRRRISPPQGYDQVLQSRLPQA